MKAYEEVKVQFYSFLTLVQLNLELGGSQNQSGCSGKYIVYVIPCTKFMNNY
jgi:hypothetical protein